MLYAKLIMAMALPALSALALLLYIFRGYRMPALFTAALSYILGVAMVAIWMMTLGFCGLPLSWPFIAGPLIINFLVFSALIFLHRPAKERLALFQTETGGENVKRDRLAKIMVFTFYGVIGLYLAVNIYEIFWRAFVMPVYTWDAIATITFKAKVLFHQQSFDIYPKLPHAKYPLLVTFLQCWTALNLGEWHEIYVNAVFPLGSLSFLVVCYYFMKFHTSRAWGLLGVALIVSSNMYLLHSSISYRDLYETIYFCLTIVFLLLWARIRHTGLMALAGFFAGTASFTKYEGSGYVLVLLAVLAYLLLVMKELPIRKKIVPALTFALPSLTIMLSYHIYKKLFTDIKLIGNEERDTITFVLSDLSRIPQTLLAYLDCLFRQSNWGIVWFIFALSLVPFILRKKTLEKQVLLLSIGLFLLLYVALAVATPSFEWLAGPKRLAGLPRLFLHFFPLAPLFIILTNYESNFLGRVSPKEPNPKAPAPGKIKKTQKRSIK